MLAFDEQFIKNESMFGRKKRERIPIYKPAECRGGDCFFYTGERCDARLELIDASGKSGGTDKSPYRDDCSYALYGRVCMGGDEQLVVGLESESPNGNASLTEMVGRAGLFEDRRIVLNTPPEEIKF